MQLNRLQVRIAEWAASHGSNGFFQTFFEQLTEETERFYAKAVSYQTVSHRASAELNALKNKWQALVNIADVRTEGMRSSDFFGIVDKLFAMEDKTVKSLLRLYGLNENLRMVLDSHQKEIMLLREAMTFLEQYDTIFAGAKVSTLESREAAAYQSA
ncbi:hypothetical protein Runsl_1348 [Runella slithyformis DSM 19594]|uniref:Uncharacterized protein n=2 Tax=Runella TaxID=105 RepID=A0A7U3ZIC8_RUNSL|nr:hypothetical protein Runsl_1348 [Runella slithyformis DSM 19594]